MRIKSDKIEVEPALHLPEQSSPPSTGPGEGVLYVDQGDGNVKFRAQNDGAVVSLSGGGGGSGVVSFGRMGTDAVGSVNATPGAYNPGFIYLGVSGWNNSTVAGAPYVTFVVDGTNGDYLLIGANGGGKYLIQFMGTANEQGPGGPEVLGGWFFAFSVNNTLTGPASGGYGNATLTVPFTVSEQVILDLVPGDQVRLELSSWGAVNTLNIGGEFIMARMEVGEDLSETLALGNATGGNDLEVSAGDVILMGESAAPATAASQGGLFVDTADNHLKYREESSGTVTDLLAGGGGPGSDTTAIHDDTAGEIALITEKGTPVSADLILIEDSADSNNKKRVQVGNLPGGSDPDAIHKSAGSELSGLTQSFSQNLTNRMLIEDQTVGGNPLRGIQFQSLRIGGIDTQAYNRFRTNEIKLTTEDTAPTTTFEFLCENDSSQKRAVKCGNLLAGISGGTWANRPTTELYDGKMYFDTALLKPFWYNTGDTTWYDATGAAHP